MTMQCLSLRALAAQALLSLTYLASAQSDTTTTTTIQLTSTILTSTTTVTLSGSTYASVTTATADIVSGSTIVQGAPLQATPMPGSGSGSYSGTAFQDAVLNSTNYFRQQHLANPVSWDSTLASYAQNYAEKCIWEHSGGPYGENLAENFATPTLAIDDWAGEEKDYNYATEHFSEAAGHYTQLVWKATTKVGCGAVNCSNSASNGANGWYLVCEYSPRGNVAGEFGENVGKAGEGKNGQPGMGGASRTGGYSRWLVALVVTSAFAVIFV